MFSKFFSAILILLFSFFCFANQQVVEDIEDALAQFSGEVCTGDDYPEDDYVQFGKMFKSLSDSVDAGEPSTIDMTDYSSYSLTLLDSSTGQECTLHHDVYDGRCNFALCF